MHKFSEWLDFVIYLESIKNNCINDNTDIIVIRTV